MSQNKGQQSFCLYSLYTPFPSLGSTCLTAITQLLHIQVPLPNFLLRFLFFPSLGKSKEITASGINSGPRTKSLCSRPKKGELRLSLNASFQEYTLKLCLTQIFDSNICSKFFLHCSPRNILIWQYCTTLMPTDCKKWALHGIQQLFSRPCQGVLSRQGQQNLPGAPHETPCWGPSRGNFPIHSLSVCCLLGYNQASFSLRGRSMKPDGHLKFWH